MELVNFLIHLTPKVHFIPGKVDMRCTPGVELLCNFDKSTSPLQQGAES